MPLVDRQPDALARLYAESLFELAMQEGGREGLESVSGELDELIELTRGMPEMNEFLASRIIPTEDRRDSLRAIFEGKVSDLLYKFLMILNEKERLNELLPIVSAFQQMVQEKFGRIEVDVYTRDAIPQDQIDAIAEEIQRALEREPVVHTYTDEKMIGGVKLQIGDKLIDASFETRLKRMNEQLKEQGGARMRERFDQAVDED